MWTSSGALKTVRWAVLILLLLIALGLLLEKNLEQVILDMAHARAEAMAVEYIHEAVQPVSQFMLGRGILANPFLAEEIQGGACNAPERTERLHNYVIDLYEDRLHHAGGSPKVLGRMKELWSYLMYSFEDPQNVWRKIKKINALKEYEEMEEKIFKEISLK